MLWARVEQSCGLSPKPLFIAADTAWRMLTQRDPDVNMLRATVATFSAGLGGANSVNVLPHTLAAGLPDALARLLIKTSDTEGALAELRAASAVESQNFEIFELTGDLEAGRKNTVEAKVAYEKASQLAPDRNAKKRVASKRKALP